MIFATVGTQLPFPRLMAALDSIAPQLGETVIAQTGPAAGDWPHLDLRTRLTPAEFEHLFAGARVVVGHAGIGTILSAKRHGKPLILLPRRHDLGEHRNDHQMATAREVEAVCGIRIAWSEADLEALLCAETLEPVQDHPSPSHAALIGRLRGFINGAPQSQQR